MIEWTTRKVDWKGDSDFLRNLFNTTWKNHPITKVPYFNWHLIDNPHGPAIAFCAIPKARDDIIAGVYLVIPTYLLVNNLKTKFSTSMYTFTHPLYYRKGIFKRLAELTYKRCVEKGICGTIGVPNKNSLHGFSDGLGFDVVGQFDIMMHFAFPCRAHGQKIKIRRIEFEDELNEVDFALDRRKSENGIILNERSKDFVRWRFFRCPGVKYKVFVAIGANDSVDGFMVLRNARIHGIPGTVIVDFIVDHTLQDRSIIAEELLSYANAYSLKSFSPFIFVLVNSLSPEAKLLGRNGYKKLTKKILPHDANFILKFHGRQSAELIRILRDFRSWYFSFADYDIY